MPKKTEFIESLGSLITDFTREISEAVDETGGDALTIEEFVLQELDLGIALTTQQMALLKAFYGLPLSDEEVSILESWAAEERTTWNEDCLGKKQQMLVTEAGRRAGKSTIASIIGAYEFYCLSRLTSPHAHYGIASSTPIAILVIATTADQGKDTIFGALTGVIESCHYFRRLIDRGEVIMGKEGISFPRKRLHIKPGNSKSASQVGYTIKCLIMDEVARFRDDNGDSNALEIWSNVGIGSVTFAEHAVRVAISSAWYEGDAIQKLYEACGRMPGMLGFRLRSWDLNPVFAARNNPVVAAEYMTEPLKASLEFEGLRSSSQGGFFQSAMVDRAFRGRSSILAVPAKTTCRDSQLSTVDLTKIGGCRNLSMHLDPAISGDSYAGALAHAEWKDNELYVVVDGLLVWEPSSGQEVSITNVYETIMTLHRRVGLRKVTADHHGSAAETLQRLTQAGIPTKRVFFSAGLQLAMYEYLRRLLSEDRLILPSDSWWTPLLVRELKQIMLIRGKKIDHPQGRGGSKDVADCIATLAWDLGRTGVVEGGVSSGRMRTMRTSKEGSFDRWKRVRTR